MNPAVVPLLVQGVEIGRGPLDDAIGSISYGFRQELKIFSCLMYLIFSLEKKVY